MNARRRSPASASSRRSASARRVLRRPGAGRAAVGPDPRLRRRRRSRCASPARCRRSAGALRRGHARSQARASRLARGGGGLAQRPAAAAVDRGAALVAAVGLEQALLEDFTPLLDGGRIDWARARGAASPACVPRAHRRHAARAAPKRSALTGPRIAHVSACAAGALAVAHAAALVERGEHEVVCRGRDRFDDQPPRPRRHGPPRRAVASPRARRLPALRSRGATAWRWAKARPSSWSRTRRARGRAARACIARIVGWGSTQDALPGDRTAPRRPLRARAPCSKALARAGLAPRGDRLRQRARHRDAAQRSRRGARAAPRPGRARGPRPRLLDQGRGRPPDGRLGRDRARRVPAAARARAAAGDGPPPRARSRV